VLQVILFTCFFSHLYFFLYSKYFYRDLVGAYAIQNGVAVVQATGNECLHCRVHPSFSFQLAACSH